MPKYNVFETTSLRAVHYAERIFDAVATEDIENGTFGYFDGLADGYDHIYNFKPGTKNGAFVVVANNPAWDEDNCRITNQRRDKYIIPAGTPFRAFVVHLNDEFATAIEGVTTASKAKMDVNAFVTIDATTGKLVASDKSTDGAIMEGQVMRKRTSGATIVTAAHTYGYSTELFEVRITALK